MLTIAVLAAFFLALAASLLRRRSLKPLPPASNQAKTLVEPWKAYAASKSPLLTLSSFPCPIIVINTVKAARELLEQRSNFASRPRWPMAELLGRQKNVGFQYYGDRLRRTRKALHGSLNAGVVADLWDDLIDQQSMRMLHSLSAHPDDFSKIVRRTIEELIVRLAYGKMPDQEFIEASKVVMQETNVALQPNKWMVNIVPQLAYVPEWMPGAQFKRWARKARETFFQLTRAPFRTVKEEILRGVAPQSFVRHALECFVQSTEDEDIVMCAAGSLYSAGTDTLASSLLTALLLLTRHPEVQSQAYEEIIGVIGTDRLPHFQDIEALPYVDCVVREIHRFNPAVPLVTHSNIEEDEYYEYRIPKKSWVMANVWAMLHDERDYPEPHAFNPQRFMPPSDQPAPQDPRALIFGFGRRICPGLHFANRTLALTISRIIAAFEITPYTENGDTIVPPLKFTTALASTPEPFRCILKPRATMKTKLSISGNDGNGSTSWNTSF